MANVEYVERVWDDINGMPLSEGEQRKTRIAELLIALADRRAARRREDPARICRIEDELILSLEPANSSGTCQKRALA